MTPLDPGYAEMLRSTASALVAKGASAADAAAQAQGVVYGTVQKHAAMMAVTDTFWILALVFVAMVPIVMLLKKTPRLTGPVPME